MLAGRLMFPPGGEVYEGRWDAPETFPARLRPLAQSELAIAEDMARPADKATISKWLASLAVLVAGGRTTAEDAKLKLGAYAAMLDGRVPVSILNRDTLDCLARQFKFLPSYAELTEELNPFVNRVMSRADRLARLLALPEPEPPPPPPTEEQKRAVAALLAKHRAPSLGPADSPA